MQQIPNLITGLNLFLGCCALVATFTGEFVMAFWLIFAAGVADFADGAAARVLKVYSEKGKQLDSLADVVSFGLVPGAMVYALLQLAWQENLPQYFDLAFVPLALPAFLLTVFAAFRLAKFNLDTRQSDEFIGLPTPAATGLIAGLLIIAAKDSFGWNAYLIQSSVLYPVLIVVSILLVSEIPMFSLKFKHFRWTGNQERYVFLAISILAFLLLGWAAFAAIMLLYILYSVLRWVAGRRA